MTPYALVGDVMAPEFLGRAAVVVEGGKILEVVRSLRSADLPHERREVPGLICPGFIDLQINGSLGVSVRPDPEALAKLARELPKTGTTSFLPTAISWPTERYDSFLEALKDASGAPGANILGAHIEGPFLAPARRGAHDPANLRPVDLGLTRKLVDSGVVRMMTLAPELPGAQEAIRLLTKSGSVASAGHTDASYEETLRAIETGLSMGTHLYNAMSPFTHRAPNAVGALLANDQARASIIADRVHVHEGALRLAYRQKGPRGLALVTDAMEAAGMLPGEYELGGRKVLLGDGEVRLPDGTLAGSALTMERAVSNAVELLRISIRDAVRMATQTPAEIVGVRRQGQDNPWRRRRPRFAGAGRRCVRDYRGWGDGL